MYARPQNNGNSKKDFEEAYRLLTDAHKAMEKARVYLACNVFHGRNYQHFSYPADKMILDNNELFLPFCQYDKIIIKMKHSLIDAIFEKDC